MAACSCSPRNLRSSSCPVDQAGSFGGCPKAPLAATARPCAWSGPFLPARVKGGGGFSHQEPLFCSSAPRSPPAPPASTCFRRSWRQESDRLWVRWTCPSTRESARPRGTRRDGFVCRGDRRRLDGGIFFPLLNVLRTVENS